LALPLVSLMSSARKALTFVSNSVKNCIRRKTPQGVGGKAGCSKGVLRTNGQRLYRSQSKSWGRCQNQPDDGYERENVRCAPRKGARDTSAAQSRSTRAARTATGSHYRASTPAGP
jgi:hypothetical protein